MSAALDRSAAIGQRAITISGPAAGRCAAGLAAGRCAAREGTQAARADRFALG